jgi:hypothetical protein
MTEFPARVRAAARLHTDRILRLPNVIGVGVARRRVGGVVTDEPAVLTYVSRKLPLDSLRIDERVPRVLDVDGDEVGTDVVEISEPHFVAVDDAQYRPLRGGCQIGRSGKAGTAGAVMYDRRDSTVVLLTNNHVVTDTGNPTTLTPNTIVSQPAGGARIGVAKRIVPMFLAPLGASGYKYYAPVDAAIVEVDDDIGAQFNVIEVAGKHPFVALPAFPGLEVVRRGYRTQLRTGTVEAVDVTMTSKSSNGDRHLIGPNVFAIRSPERLISAMPGDSGSLVVDADGGASRGLVFASDEQSGGLTWACDLLTIMSMLEIETVCTGARNALIRRAVRKRFTDSWAAAERIDAAGGSRNPFVDDVTTKVHRFTEAYLPTKRDGSPGSAIGHAFALLGPELADALNCDEDAAGLFERAFGDWLVTPTVFDMLEYRFPQDAADHMKAAFGRIRDRARQSPELDLLERIFSEAAGRSMREVLGHPAGSRHNYQPEKAAAATRR